MTRISSCAGLLLLLASILLREAKAAWEQTAKLVDLDGVLNARFGEAIAIDNGILAVGATIDGASRGGTLYIRAGTATIFELVDREWSHAAKLIASDVGPGDQFGRSVAASDGVVAVGANLEDDGGFQAGAVYVFGKEVGGTWTEQAKLLPHDTAREIFFGVSVAMQGNTLIVGARGGRGITSDTGAVYVYTFSADSWTENAKLTASDGSAGDYFGWSVAIDAETLVVGASRDDDLGGSSGSAYVFQVVGGLWTQQAKLTSSEGTAGDTFGNAVAIEGGTVCVGSYNNVDGSAVGAVYIFGQEGDTWTQQTKLVASDLEAGGLFGASLTLKEDLLLVGSYGHDSSTGAVYLFDFVESGWTQQAQLVSSDGDTGDEVGYAVDFDDGIVIAGAGGDDSDGGAAYAFEWRASESPSLSPSSSSSSMPTQVPSISSPPSRSPSELPTQVASQEPSSTSQPSDWLSEEPSFLASEPPTSSTSEQPSESSDAPSVSPSDSPGAMPSLSPSTSSSNVPTQLPSVDPSSPPPTGRSSSIPSELPSTVATQEPTNTPIPSGSSSEQPSSVASVPPTISTSEQPSSVASVPPTISTSEQPSESSTEPSTLASESPGAIPSLPPSETPVIASNFSLSHPVIETGFVRIIEGSIIDAAALLNNTYARAGFQVTYDASVFDDVASVRLGIGGDFICLQAAPFERNISADGYTELVSELFSIADCEGTMVHREQVSFNFYECPFGICVEADVEMVWTDLTQYNITNRTGVLCDCVACPFGGSEECDNDTKEDSDVTTTEATRMDFGYSDPVNRERELLGEHRSGFYERLEAFNGGWNTSRANRTLLFKVQDSDECLEREVQEGGGRRTASRRLNPAFSGGRGTATIHTERDVYMWLDIQGRAAATVAQNMTVWFNGRPLVEGRGGTSSPSSPDCTNTDPRLTYFESSPIRILLDAGSDHVLYVRFESASGTLGSYFQLVLAFEDIGSAEPTKAPDDPDPQLPTSSPSEIAPPTTAPSQTPKEDPTESPPSVSSAQGPSHMPSPPLSVSPTRGLSMEPTYSPTTVSPTDSDPHLPTSSPSEMDAPTTAPTQPPQDEPTEYPSFSGTQEPTRSQSQLPSTSPPHSTTISPTGGQSVEPTYSPTAASSQLPSVFAPDFSGFAQDGCIMYEIPDNSDEPVDVRSTGRTPRICVAVDFCESQGTARTVCSCTALIPGSVVRTIGRGGHGPRRFGRECGCSVCDDGKGIDVDCGSFGIGCRGAETFLRRLDL